MKRIFALFFLLLLFCGCSMNQNRNSIEDTSLIRIFGIDYKDGLYTVTVLYNDNSVSDEEKTFKSLTADGKTVYEAYENVKQKSEKFPSLSQIKFFILSADSAKQGINEIIDFAIRHEQIKTDVQVMLLGSGQVSEMLKGNEGSDSFLGDTLQTTQHKEQKTISHVDCSLDNIHSYFVSNTKSFLIINLVSDDNIYIDGYGVFNNGKLVDTVDRETSMGIDFILGNIRSAPIYTPDFSALITYIKSKRIVDIENTQVTYTVKTKYSTTIYEVLTDNINKDESALEEEQNAYVNSLIQKAFDYTQSTGYDILNVENLLKAKRPKKWEEIKNNFNVKGVNFVAQTFSEVDKTFNSNIMEAK